MDGGNSSLHFGEFLGPKLQDQWRLPSHPVLSEAEYKDWFSAQVAQRGLPRGLVFGSVFRAPLPNLTSALLALGIPVLEITRRELEQVGFGVAAEGAGIDRLVNGYAAWNKWKRDLVVVDLGTATTFDVVAQPGVFLGGAIFTGIELCAKALAQNAEALFEVPLEFPKQIIGKNTKEALQSGILFGYSSLVETMLEKIAASHGANLFGIATGGLAHVLYDQTTHLDRWEPALTLEGLAGLALDERINGNLKPRVGHGRRR